MMPVVIYVLSPEENTQACEENARSIYYGNHHYAVKELLVLPDYLVRRMEKAKF
jgi:hypothetical protein